MAFSLRNVVNCGILLAAIDLLHGIATCSFYGYELAVHYRCHRNHGLRWCEYYLVHTDHSVRVNIGIAEGLAGLFFSTVLIIGLCKYKPFITWMWLFKALSVIVINIFFLTGWIVKKSGYYHSFWERHNYDQDNAFIFAGLVLTLIQFILVIFFFCLNCSFTYKIRKQRVPAMESDI